jgi:two-component system, NarL family, response regulator YdfI
VTRVLIVARSVVMQVGLEAVVATSPSLEVVGSLTEIEALPQAIEQLQPDVVLLDWELQDEELPNLPTINGQFSAPAIVLLLDEFSSSWIADALRSGIKGLLPNDAIAVEIVAAITAAADGIVTLHPEMIDALLSAFPTVSRALPTTAEQPLTPREIEVLGMLAEGLGNKAIAKRLNLSEHTVKFHISSIFAKLNVSSRTEAVTIGVRQGFILL